MGIFDFSPTSEEKGIRSPFMEDTSTKEAPEEVVEESKAERIAPSVHEHELLRDMKEDVVPQHEIHMPLSEAIPKKKLTIKSEEVTTRRIEERSIEVDNEAALEEERTFTPPVSEQIVAPAQQAAPTPTPVHAEVQTRRSVAEAFELSAKEHHDSLLEILSLQAAGALVEKYGLSPMEAAYVEHVLQEENGLSFEERLEKLAGLLDEERAGHNKLKSILSLYGHFKEGIASVRNIVRDIENILADDKKES